MKLQISKVVSATFIFCTELQAFQVTQAQCVRLERLLLAKLNLLHFEMVRKSGCDLFLFFN